MLGSTLQLLIGDQVTTASEGDLAFAPPGLAAGPRHRLGLLRQLWAVQLLVGS